MDFHRDFKGESGLKKNVCSFDDARGKTFSFPFIFTLQC